MKIYEEFEMLTFGNVPTAKVEIPVSVPIPTPTPFIPNWVKWLIAGLIVVLGILIGMEIHQTKKRKREDDKKNKEKALNLATISEQDKVLSNYGLKK